LKRWLAINDALKLKVRVIMEVLFLFGGRKRGGDGSLSRIAAEGWPSATGQA
jgi:hypothetical protein